MLRKCTNSQFHPRQKVRRNPFGDCEFSTAANHLPSMLPQKKENKAIFNSLFKWLNSLKTDLVKMSL